MKQFPIRLFIILTLSLSIWQTNAAQTTSQAPVNSKPPPLPAVANTQPTLPLPATADTDLPLPAPDATPAPELPSQMRTYPLGVGDEITIRVQGEPQFDGQYEINEFGNVELPFLKEPVQIACKTDRQARAALTSALRMFLRNPQVYIRVAERRSRPAAVVQGEVRNPQPYDLRRKVRLFELLAFSGGVSTESASGVITIWHTVPKICTDVTDVTGNPNTDLAFAATTRVSDDDFVPSETFQLRDVREGKIEANPLINPGDVVVVERSKPIYVIGEVRNPQGVYLQEGGSSLGQVIGQLGGINKTAKSKDIKIYRVKPGLNSNGVKDREIISVNYDAIRKGQQEDIQLQAYDIVEVDRAKKSVAKTILELATGLGNQAIQTVGGAIPARIVY